MRIRHFSDSIPLGSGNTIKEERVGAWTEIYACKLDAAGNIDRGQVGI